MSAVNESRGIDMTDRRKTLLAEPAPQVSVQTDNVAEEIGAASYPYGDDSH